MVVDLSSRGRLKYTPHACRRSGLFGRLAPAEVAGMEYLVLVFLHVFFGIIWAGGAIAAGLFIVPSVIEAGPAAGAVMAGVVRRRFPAVMTAAAIIVVLAGARLYMLRFSSEWLTTPQGIVLTLGAILGIGAFVLGVFIQRPLVGRMGALAAQIAASGAGPTSQQAGELQALRQRLQKIARLTALHLLGAALLMAMQRLVAAF
jgi:uncharacterized membrane protein